MILKWKAFGFQMWNSKSKHEEFQPGEKSGLNFTNMYNKYLGEIKYLMTSQNVTEIEEHWNG